MNILAIDPGQSQTGWCIMSEDMKIWNSGIDNNDYLLKVLDRNSAFRKDRVAIEMIASYGMPVGREVFETCIWIGRFMQVAPEPDKVMLVYRKDVKLHLCGSPRAKDANIRQAILDLYPRTGGGSTPQIGTKAQPGPLYGVSSHVWPAIGVALVAHHQSKTLVLTDTLPLYHDDEVVGCVHSQEE